MPKQISSDLDQVVNIYRTKMRHVEDLWSRLVQHGQCDTSLVKTANEMLDQIDTTSMHLLEEQVLVEKAGCRVRNLRQVLDVSRQILEAKVQHLKAEEQQIERERNIRYKEFQKIHKIQEEKDVVEKSLVPAKEKMSTLLDTLSKKCTKQKYLEEFAGCLTEELSKDLNGVIALTETAREERGVWDRFNVDVFEELSRFVIDDEEMKGLRSGVVELKNQLQNQNNWYEEELRTKLFYSSRNKEIQNKIANYKTTIKRLERSARHEDWGEAPDRTSPLDDFSTSVMIDGVPDIQAKDVEDFLSQQFGVRVLADYSMLKRMKDEIGVLGLAYLVERIRYQNHAPCISKSTFHRTFKDLEEQQIELALETIAKEYRANEERTRCQMALSPDRSQRSRDHDHPDTEHNNTTVTTPRFFLASPRRLAESDGLAYSPLSVSTPTGSSAIDFDEGPPNIGSNHCSTGSLKSKNSLSRIKKIFKL